MEPAQPTWSAWTIQMMSEVSVDSRLLAIDTDSQRLDSPRSSNADTVAEDVTLLFRFGYTGPAGGSSRENAMPVDTGGEPSIEGEPLRAQLTPARALTAEDFTAFRAWTWDDMRQSAVQAPQTRFDDDKRSMVLRHGVEHFDDRLERAELQESMRRHARSDYFQNYWEDLGDCYYYCYYYSARSPGSLSISGNHY